MRMLDKQDLKHLAIGATFLGSGGGGTLSSMLGLIETLDSNARVELVSVEEAAADEEKLTCVCGFLGSQEAAVDQVDPRGAPNAVQYFEESFVRPNYHKSIGHLVPVEMGVQSSVIPACFIAMLTGMKVVDADGAGRAVPALAATTCADRLPLSPVVVSDFGKLRMTLSARSVLDLKRPPIVNLGQAARGVAGGLRSGIVGIALWPMDAATIGAGLPIRGTLDLARRIGKRLADAKEQHVDPIDDVLKLLEPHYGWQEVIFEGVISDVDRSRPDYLAVTVASTDDKVVVHTAGENTIAWDYRTGQPLAMAPDSICWLTRKGDTFSNTEIPSPGTPVCLVGIAAQDSLREGRTVNEAAFGWVRAAVGYPGAYRKIESLNAHPSRWKRIPTSRGPSATRRPPAPPGPRPR